jgi:hypothetical protein
LSGPADFQVAKAHRIGNPAINQEFSREWPDWCEAREDELRSVLFLGFVAISGAAVAQTDAQTSTTGTATSAPGNQAPERDARGIPVVSDPAEVPAGANQAVIVPPGAQVVIDMIRQQQVFTTQQATGPYPACSRTVTDNCVQLYERGITPFGPLSSDPPFCPEAGRPPCP